MRLPGGDDRGPVRGRRRPDRPDVGPPQVAHGPGGAPHPRAELRVRPPVEPEAPREVRRAARSASTRATARTSRRRSSRPTARSSTSTARSTWATMARSCFPSLPENLVSKPTLMWLLRNAATAPQRIEASYLTGGITWKADYVVVLNAADDRADLTGWVTIDNKSGATYSEAALKLVAGDVNRARDDRTRQAMEMAAKAVGGGAGLARLRLGGVLRVPPLHAGRADHAQGQPDQAAHAHEPPPASPSGRSSPSSAPATTTGPSTARP